MLSDNEYQFLVATLEREYGVDLRAASPEVIEAKIGKYREKHNLASTAECIEQIRQAGPQGAALGDVVYSQRTCFNRSPEHFEFVVNTLRREPRVDVQGAPARIWCAACSTGQEAYTLAIYLLEHAAAAPAGFRIVASDCSQSALAVAAAGRYHVLDVRELEPIKPEPYFTRESEEVWVVRPHVRRDVEFKLLNLVTSDYGFGPEFDFAFLRNALDFHSPQSRAAILSAVRRTLAPGGWLVLGDCPRLEPEDVVACGYALDEPGCYRAT